MRPPQTKRADCHQLPTFYPDVARRGIAQRQIAACSGFIRKVGQISVLFRLASLTVLSAFGVLAFVSSVLVVALLSCTNPFAVVLASG